MSRTTLLTTFLTICLIPSVFAQNSLIYESGGELIYEQAAFDVKHYELDLRVDPSDSTITGSVTMKALMVHPSNVIVLDLDPRLTIESVADIVRGETNQLKFERSPDSKRVRIYFHQTHQPGDPITVSIVYSGKPLVAENPPWDGGFVWERTPSGEPWVGVANQTIGAWVWWPNKDHPSDKPDSVTINYTMPDDLVVASNGRFRGTTDAGDGWKTWHWFVSMPINNYNVTLNAAPYDTISETYQSVAGDEMEITFWVLPDYIGQGRELFPQFSEQIRFLEELLGPYPFRADKYGVAHAPYLGMEHQSLIAYGANFMNDNMFGQNAGFDDLHQHELAHEWWGNLVTAWDWKDFWIHEGFGTYMQPLYAEHLKGEAAYRDMMEMMRGRIVSRETLAPYHSKSTVEVYGSGRGGDIYYKGAWFLHTLRYVIGDEHFFQVLRRFAYPDSELESVTDGRHVRHVTTNDFLYLSERISGMDLKWLFDVYLRQPELPRLQESRKEGKLKLTWEVPEEFSFPMPVDVEINGEIIRAVPEKDEIVLEADEDAVIMVDPDHRILKAFTN